MEQKNSLYSKEFHDRSRRLYRTDKKEWDSSLWPKEWTTIYYKKYERFPRIKLPLASAVSSPLGTVLDGRKTERKFSGAAVSIDELSCWLKYVCGETTSIDSKRTRRTYPSGGARYSVEHYILVLKGSSSLKSGIYHYRVDLHELEVFSLFEFTQQELSKITEVEWIKDAAFVHLMTSVFWRSQNKYNERGYRLILLEAGHVGQNAYLVSGALGLGCCALSGVFDDTLEEFLDIDGKEESLVHAVVVGKK